MPRPKPTLVPSTATFVATGRPASFGRKWSGGAQEAATFTSFIKEGQKREERTGRAFEKSVEVHPEAPTYI